MRSGVLVVVCSIILIYMWHDEIIAKIKAPFQETPKVASVACNVQGNSCEDLVRMLNNLRPGRYYEAAAQLVGVTNDDNNLYRDGGAIIFKLPDGRTLIHNQGVVNREKGYLTVEFPGGPWLKYDDKGNFVEEGQ